MAQVAVLGRHEVGSDGGLSVGVMLVTGAGRWAGSVPTAKESLRCESEKSDAWMALLPQG